MRYADAVAAALRYSPGVNTELRGEAVGRLDLFSIRGFINYQNYYDGMQLLYNDWNLQPQIDLLAVEHNLLVGFDYLDLKSDVIYEDTAGGNGAPSIDLFDPNHQQISRSTIDIADTPYSSDFNIEKKQLAVYLQDQVRIDRFVMIGGVRWDDFTGTENGKQYGTAVDAKLDQDNVSARAGIMYQAANGLSPYLNYAESFEPQTGRDRNGNEFDASIGDQWELGVKYQSPDQRTTANLAFYQITKENVPTRDPAGGPYDKIQAGAVRSQGLELEALAQPLNNLTNERYYSCFDSANRWFGEERTLEASVSYTF